MWLSPITDRTLEDVRYAESKVVEWIAAYSRGETPTVTDLKGCVNASDLNRVEGNLDYLNQRIVFKGGFPDDMVVKTWERGEVVLTSDVVRLLRNARWVARMYGVSGVVHIPSVIIEGYEDMNYLEIMTQLAKEKVTASWGQLSSRPWGDMSDTYWDDVIRLTIYVW